MCYPRMAVFLCADMGNDDFRDTTVSTSYKLNCPIKTELRIDRPKSVIDVCRESLTGIA